MFHSPHRHRFEHRMAEFQEGFLIKSIPRAFNLLTFMGSSHIILRRDLSGIIIAIITLLSSWLGPRGLRFKWLVFRSFYRCLWRQVYCQFGPVSVFVKARILRMYHVSRQSSWIDFYTWLSILGELIKTAHLAGAVEYTDYTSAEV